MKVAELIKRLRQLDGELPVLVRTEELDQSFEHTSIYVITKVTGPVVLIDVAEGS